jgi:hypothetical protein
MSTNTNEDIGDISKFFDKNSAFLSKNTISEPLNDKKNSNNNYLIGSEMDFALDGSSVITIHDNKLPSISALNSPVSVVNSPMSIVASPTSKVSLPFNNNKIYTGYNVEDSMIINTNSLKNYKNLYTSTINGNSIKPSSESQSVLTPEEILQLKNLYKVPNIPKSMTTTSTIIYPESGSFPAPVSMDLLSDTDDDDDLPELEINNTHPLSSMSIPKKTKEKFVKKLFTVGNSGNSEEYKLTTEGLHVEQMSDKYFSNTRQCMLCMKYYNHNMIMNADGEHMCQHCFFMINYDEEKRLEVDTKYINMGYCVAMYISECSDNHNVQTCEKSACYLCDYKNKKPIKNILLSESIYPDGAPSTQDATPKYIPQNDISKIQTQTQTRLEPVLNIEPIYFQEEEINQNFKIPQNILI